MSKFVTQDITQQGLELLAKALTGDSITFTKIMLGAGSTDLPARQVEQLVLPIVELEIVKLERGTDGSAIVGSVFSNAEMTNGFTYRELGVFAKDSEDNEILYAYANAGDYAEEIPEGDTGGNVVEKIIDAVVVVGNAENVTAIVNTDAYATIAQVNAALAAALAAQIAAEAAQTAATGAHAEASAANAAVTAAVNQINTNASNIQILWDAIFNDITGNPFSITFTDLTGLIYVSGVWNTANARLEC